MVSRGWSPWLPGQQRGTVAPSSCCEHCLEPSVYGGRTAATQMAQLHPDLSSDPKKQSFGGGSCGSEAGAVQDRVSFCLIMQGL